MVLLAHAHINVDRLRVIRWREPHEAAQVAELLGDGCRDEPGGPLHGARPVRQGPSRPYTHSKRCAAS